MQKRVVSGIESILNQANYVRIDHKDVAMILTQGIRITASTCRWTSTPSRKC